MQIYYLMLYFFCVWFSGLVHRSCICDNKAEKVREQRFPEWSDLSDLWSRCDGSRLFPDTV